MKRLKKSNEYDYKQDLNWRDDGNGSPDGQGVEDPSINDFLKGYQMDPYEFRQWAKDKKGIVKKAWVEVDVLQFTPEYLADKILKVWNSSDGLLQNFYESFCLRYNNKLKIDIAEELMKNGYKVYPLLIEDKPIYAKSDSMKKLVLAIAKDEKFKTSIALHKLSKDIKDEEVSKDNMDTLLNYYSLIYPKDYAISLVTDLINTDDKDKNKSFDFYRDFQLSNESLSAIEKYLSGNQDPIAFNDGGNNGYDFSCDMRYDTTAPNNYEITAKKKEN